MTPFCLFALAVCQFTPKFSGGNVMTIELDGRMPTDLYEHDQAFLGGPRF